MSDAQDYDPRIVDLYDIDNPDGPDHDFYRALADSRGARRVLDLGCGTGILTVTLAAEGRRVVGADPSASMLAYARARPGAEQVEWIEGDASAVAAESFDLILMTGNVAQHIPDPAWMRTLQQLRAVAASGATLAFESRNPEARAWESWTQEQPSVRDTPHGPLTEWSEVEERGDGIVLLRAYNSFERTGETVVEEHLLTFRTEERITQDLQAAGFETAAVWGDWARAPIDGGQRLMIFEATPTAPEG
jgi:SAM-dependent methyltransferase